MSLAPGKAAAAPTIVVHWRYFVPIVGVHLLALLALLPALFSWWSVLVMLAGVHLFGSLGVNLCYHRLLTHRSFSAPKWFEYFLATVGVCCLEDTPIRWVATHRLHHTHSDENRDPHSPRRSFLWGHVGWLLTHNAELESLTLYEKYARDLLADRYYFYLEKNRWAAAWIYLAHAAAFYFVGLLVGRWWGGTWTAGATAGLSLLVWGVFVRTVVTWHITWSVNSLTHLFGYRTYETDEHSRNNWLVAMIAAGEGWHNNHHHDPASASVQHRWWEVDLTYYTIVVFERLGLARNVIRPRHARQAKG